MRLLWSQMTLKWMGKLPMAFCVMLSVFLFNIKSSLASISPNYTVSLSLTTISEIVKMCNSYKCDKILLSELSHGYVVYLTGKSVCIEKKCPVILLLPNQNEANHQSEPYKVIDIHLMAEKDTVDVVLNRQNTPLSFTLKYKRGCQSTMNWFEDIYNFQPCKLPD